MRDRITALKKNHGKKVVDTVTICNVINGLRGVKALTCDTSRADPIKGIHFRDLTLKECLKRLPNHIGTTISAPEGMFWFLLTGEIPTCEQLLNLSAELKQRATIPEYSTQIINSLSKDLDPLTHFSIGLMAIQPESRFDSAYNQGIRKTEYWEPTIEDAIDLMAKLPTVAAMVYNNKYSNTELPQWDDSLDWAGNFAKKLGVTDPV